jgi:hypothetical protein
VLLDDDGLDDGRRDELAQRRLGVSSTRSVAPEVSLVWCKCV